MVSAETIPFFKFFFFNEDKIQFIERLLIKETIQGRKSFKGGNYSRAETICGNTVFTWQSMTVHLLERTIGKIARFFYKRCESISQNALICDN
jgi:hypothetical protein